MYNKTGFPSHYIINLQSTAAMTVLCLYSPGNSTRSKPDISDSNTWEEKNSKQTAFVRSNKVKRKKKAYWHKHYHHVHLNLTWIEKL